MAGITSYNSGNHFALITSATTTQVVTGRGVLRRIIFNTPIASSTVKLIDGISGSTANIGTITNTSAVEPYSVEYNVKFSAGLRIVTSGADNITVVYD